MKKARLEYILGSSGKWVRETERLGREDIKREQGLRDLELRSVFRGLGFSRHLFFSSGPFSSFLEEELEKGKYRQIGTERFSSRNSGVCL